MSSSSPQIFPFLIVISQPIRLYGPSQTTSSLIVVLAILIPHLSTRLASAVLSTLLKTRIQIRPDDALVEFSAANVLHAVESVLVCVVFDEAEATGGFVEAVEAHNEALDLTAFGEEFVDLFFSGIKGAGNGALVDCADYGRCG